MVFLSVSNVWCLILFQMSALGSLLREPNWRNLEEAGRLITVGENGAGSLDYLKFGVRRETRSLTMESPCTLRHCQACPMRTSMKCGRRDKKNTLERHSMKWFAVYKPIFGLSLGKILLKLRYDPHTWWTIWAVVSWTWKIQVTQRDSNPWPLRCRCSALTNWATKSHSWE